MIVTDRYKWGKGSKKHQIEHYVNVPISSAKSLLKVENLQKQALWFLQNDCGNSYEELLKKLRKQEKLLYSQ